MAAVFDDVRLPDDVEQGAHGGPMFQTTIVPISSGSEQRNQDWAEQLCEFDVGYGIQSIADFFAVRQFFYGRRGRARAFRFKDWSDYAVPEPLTTATESIATGDGMQTVFQIIKTYEGGGPHSYGRRITRPVSATAQVYLDGVLQVSGFTVDYSTGEITFSPAPSNGVVVGVTCEFDVPCRFDVDKFDLTIEGFQAGVVQNLKIVEVRE